MVESVADRIANYILDFGSIMSSPEEVKEMVEDMVNLIEESGVELDFILGHHLITTEEERYNVENTVSLARLVGRIIKKQHGVIYEDDGMSPSCTGDVPFGKIAIIDGAANTGDSIIRTVDYLKSKDSSLIVEDAFVLMARPGGETLKKLENKLSEKGIKLHYKKTGLQIIIERHEQGKIPDERFNDLMQDPDFQ